MTLTKRALDIGLAVMLLVIFAMPFGLLLLALLVVQGRPLFHVADRMKAPGQGFWLWKLRTMTLTDGAERGVSGGDKARRVTRVGRVLRRARLDEVPQLWNVLRGDMSFVGPRPPLREYVERFPEVYAEVLKSRPGITGLASLRFHRREERLLSGCRDAAETDRVYVERCIPAKARLDLIYQRHQSVCFDLALIWQTGVKVFFGRVFRLGRG